MLTAAMRKEGWLTSGHEWIGRELSRTTDTSDEEGNVTTSITMCMCVAWLPATVEDPFVDAEGKKVPLFKVHYMDGELEGEFEDLEAHEVEESIPFEDDDDQDQDDDDDEDHEEEDEDDEIEGFRQKKKRKTDKKTSAKRPRQKTAPTKSKTDMPRRVKRLPGLGWASGRSLRTRLARCADTQDEQVVKTRPASKSELDAWKALLDAPNCVLELPSRVELQDRPFSLSCALPENRTVQSAGDDTTAYFHCGGPVLAAEADAARGVLYVVLASSWAVVDGCSDREARIAPSKTVPTEVLDLARRFYDVRGETTTSAAGAAAAGGGDKAWLQVWDLFDPKKPPYVAILSPPAVDARVAPDGSLALVGADGALRVYAPLPKHVFETPTTQGKGEEVGVVELGRPLMTAEPEQCRICSARWSPHEPRLVCCGLNDGGCVLYRPPEADAIVWLEGARCRDRPAPAGRACRAVGFDVADPSVVAVANDSGWVQVWRLDDSHYPVAEHRLREVSAPSSVLALPSGKGLVVATFASSTVSLIDLDTYRLSGSRSDLLWRHDFARDPVFDLDLAVPLFGKHTKAGGPGPFLVASAGADGAVKVARFQPDSAQPEPHTLLHLAVPAWGGKHKNDDDSNSRGCLAGGAAGIDIAPPPAGLDDLLPTEGAPPRGVKASVDAALAAARLGLGTDPTDAVRPSSAVLRLDLGSQRPLIDLGGKGDPVIFAPKRLAARSVRFLSGPDHDHDQGCNRPLSILASFTCGLVVHRPVNASLTKAPARIPTTTRASGLGARSQHPERETVLTNNNNVALQQKTATNRLAPLQQAPGQDAQKKADVPIKKPKGRPRKLTPPPDAGEGAVSKTSPGRPGETPLPDVAPIPVVAAAPVPAQPAVDGADARAPKKKRGRPKKALDESAAARGTLQASASVNPDDGAAPPKKRGRPRKSPVPDSAPAVEGAGTAPEGTDEAQKKKRGRPRKTPPPLDGTASAVDDTAAATSDKVAPIAAAAGEAAQVVPADESSKKKRGRPRKTPPPLETAPRASDDDAVETAPETAHASPQQDAVSNDAVDAPPVPQGPDPQTAADVPQKKKRGRPRKTPAESPDPAKTAGSPPTDTAGATGETVALDQAAPTTEAPQPKKKRGRPRKNPAPVDAVAAGGAPVAEQPPKKKRGRPPKPKTPAPHQTEAETNDNGPSPTVSL